MTRFKWLLCALLLTTFFGSEARANTLQAASCNTGAVQTAINSAAEGDTVVIPAGTCTWTSGVSISGKGITVQGTGAGRVIAVDVETSAITIGAGTKTFSNVVNDQGATPYLTNAALLITNGQTLRIIENGWLGNFMQGTVASFSGGVLTMNITSSGGTCGLTGNNMNSNCKRWLVTTLPSTVLIDNLTSGAMFTVTEDTSVHTTITGIHFAQGSGGGGAGIEIAPFQNNSSGSCYGGSCSLLIHDNFFESQQADLIDGKINRGVIWNNSFVFSPFSPGQWAAIRVQDGNNTVMSNSWNTVSSWGAADTNGNNSLFFETNDIHADGNAADISDDSRMVLRYNVWDNAGTGGHGADTGNLGERTVEYYNNAGIFESYGDGSTAGMNWWMNIRGGTFVWHDNTLPAISSQDFGSKSDIALINEPLQRQQGPFACWGAGFSKSGQHYARPHQVGFGYINGTTAYTYSPLGYNNATTYSNVQQFQGTVSLGDSEPAYVWNNNRSMNVGVGDYCSSTLGGYNCGGQPTYCPNSPEPDVAAAYIQSGRDFFNGTAKPGYTPYTYPHPLTAGQDSGNLPAPPTNLTGTVQ